jgi:hypothetical protein
LLLCVDVVFVVLELIGTEIRTMLDLDPHAQVGEQHGSECNFQIDELAFQCPLLRLNTHTPFGRRALRPVCNKRTREAVHPLQQRRKCLGKTVFARVDARELRVTADAPEQRHGVVKVRLGSTYRHGTHRRGFWRGTAAPAATRSADRICGRFA